MYFQVEGYGKVMPQLYGLKVRVGCHIKFRIVHPIYHCIHAKEEQQKLIAKTGYELVVRAVTLEHVPKFVSISAFEVENGKT